MVETVTVPDANVAVPMLAFDPVAMLILLPAVDRVRLPVSVVSPAALTVIRLVEAVLISATFAFVAWEGP